MGLGESFADAANARHRPPASKLSPVDRSAIATILLFSVFAIFATIGLHGMTDAKYSMLVSENLMQHHSLAMDARSMPQLPPFSRPGYGKSGYPYQIEVKNGKVLYWYPVGTSLLSLPFVAFMNMAGVSAHTADGGYDETGEDNIQEILAAFLMATLAVIFFRTALLLLPVSWSVVLALGGVFSTQIWSTASRVLWSHTWQIFLIGLALYMLLAQEEGEVNERPVVLATILSWAYFVRPTSSIPIIGIGAYVLFFHRRAFMPLVATGIIWLLLFVVYSLKVYGTLLPGYYLFHLSSGRLLEGVAGNLISPSRGLFVFVPGAAFVLWLVGRYWRMLSHRQLVFLALSVIAVHTLVVSTDPNWWGGHCYGARMTIDTVPWFYLLAVLGGRCLADEHPSRLKHFAVALGILTLVIGAAMNGNGAISNSANDWVNGPPEDVDRKPARVWDLRHPQFLSRAQSSDSIDRVDLVLDA